MINKISHTYRLIATLSARIFVISHTEGCGIFYTSAP